MISNKTLWRNDDGLALLTVLAVLAVLSIMVLEFSTSVMLDLDISSNFRNQTQAEYNARAGLQYAVKLLRDTKSTNDTLQDQWAEPQEIYIGDLIRHYKNAEELEEEEVSTFSEEEKPDPVDHRLGRAYILIIDEERKININRIMKNTESPNIEFKEIFENLLTNLEYPDLDIRGLLDNIIDWIDVNEDGAAEKSTHYEYLENPYEPVNTYLASIYEMLLIKDMNSLILFGNTPYPMQETGKEEEEEEYYEYTFEEETDYEEIKFYGLCNFITPHTSGQVNVNTAPREVLLAMLDSQEYLVDNIIERRLETPFERYSELQTILKTISNDYSTAKTKLFTIRSRIFKIESIGEYGNSRVRLITLLRRGGTQEVQILYQRMENMSSEEKIHFIKEGVSPGIM